MSNVFDKLVSRAMHTGKRIVLTETEDERILEAAENAAKTDLCKVVLVGDESKLKSKFTDDALKNIVFANNAVEDSKFDDYVNLLYEIRKNKGMTIDQAKIQLKNKLTYAMMMLKNNDADGVVSGAITHTADVLRPAFQIVKVKEGVSKVSSFMIMESPNSNYGENGFLIFADCGVNPNPTDLELAEIAILAAESAEKICGITPRVAMLSYSTKSGEDVKDENVNKVRRATEIVKLKRPDLIVDGEIQADAALVESVAKLKCPKSELNGKANILVFPDLSSGNIAYKLVQRLAGVRAVGPLLQGLNAPVNDLSRGTSADEILLCMAITILQI